MEKIKTLCFLILARWHQLAAILLPVLLLITPLQTKAEINDTWYLGLGAGVSRLNLDTNNTGYLIESDRDTGYRLFGGYDLNRDFSIELVLASLGEVTLNNQGYPTLIADGSIDYFMGGFNVLWYLWPGEKREGFHLFAQAGLSVMGNTGNVPFDSSTVVGATLSGGVEYDWQNNYSLRLAADIFSNDATFIYLGVIKRFGVD